MWKWVHAYKPAASYRAHLLAAALLWSGVGSGLLFFGGRWVVRTHHRYAIPLALAAAAAGVAKSEWVLKRAASRVIERIRFRGDGRCIGGFLSVRTWCVVVAMMLLGRWMRTGHVPRLLVGLLYVAVGTALLLASRYLWRAWHDARSGPVA